MQCIHAKRVGSIVQSTRSTRRWKACTISSVERERDRSTQQTPIPYVEANRLPSQSVERGLFEEEEQMVKSFKKSFENKADLGWLKSRLGSTNTIQTL